MNNPKHSALNVSLFGASPDTGNQGVNALHDALLAALTRRGISKTSVFGFSPGITHVVEREGKQMDVETLPAYRTKRFYSYKSMLALKVAASLKLKRHSGASALLSSHAIMDFSAGDSFTDLYGWSRFLDIIEPKLLAIRQGIPLVLLPQTIGPFQSKKARQLAARVLKSATQVWARDDESYQLLEEIVGESSRPNQLKRGVDMAFLLDPKDPGFLPKAFRERKEVGGQNRPLVGINVSGLIYNDPNTSSEQFGLSCDYRKTLNKFLDWILRATDANVVLVPHVLTRPGSMESDYDASVALMRTLPADVDERISVLSPSYTASELKWFISQLDWFCGTRMHSTIAALGSGVPTASLAYSMKTHGIFSDCGLGDQVVELRHTNDEDAFSRLVQSFDDRGNLKKRLSAHLLSVRGRANKQMDEIVAMLNGGFQSAEMRAKYSDANNQVASLVGKAV